MLSTQLTGRAFDVDLGPFVPRLTFMDNARMRLVADIGTTHVDEIVDVQIEDVAPDVLMVTWTESSGNFVVQVQDHGSGRVLNQARLADGTVFSATGRIAAA